MRTAQDHAVHQLAESATLVGWYVFENHGRSAIEPRFGNIKSVHGFRQFSIRGYERVPNKDDPNAPKEERHRFLRVADIITGPILARYLGLCSFARSSSL